MFFREFKMGKGIYTYYKERLIEIGGKSKCLYLKNIQAKGAYDIGRLFEGRDDKVSELLDFLWLKNKKQPLTLISENEADDIIRGLPESPSDSSEGKRSFSSALQKRVIDSEVSKIKELGREIEEIQKETGRYELFIGYPFVFGSISSGINKMLIKAPLLLFPVKIHVAADNRVELFLSDNESIQLNRALLFAYAQAKKLSIEDVELEFEDLSAFDSLSDIIAKLDEAKIKIEFAPSKHLYAYDKFKEPDFKGELSIRYAAVLGRFPISNSIYTDYTLLEKQKLTNDAIDELIRAGGKKSAKRIQLLEKEKLKARAKAAKKEKKTGIIRSYAVKLPDYSQSEVVKQVDKRGNMVIWGPPGTGKSQTIVNVITDAIAKNKKVLVVSQKKAALDVVYSRLGHLGERAMYINDEAKERRKFYSACKEANERVGASDTADLTLLAKEYDELDKKIAAEIAILEKIDKTLNEKRPFGLSLSEMYSSSYMLQKNTGEYALYSSMLDYSEILGMTHKGVEDALFTIKAKNLDEMYYKFIQAKEKNPLMDMMRPDLDIHTLSDVRGLLDTAHNKARRTYFNLAKYPYLRQVLAYYSQLSDPKVLDAVVKTTAKIEHPSVFGRKKHRNRIRWAFLETLNAIEEHVDCYECLNRIMTRDGYISVIDNILRGNHGYIKLVHEALDSYIALRDVSNLLSSIDKNMLAMLDFAYTNSKSFKEYGENIAKILPLRIYHEILRYEEAEQEELARTLDFENITSKITKLQEEETKVAAKICGAKASGQYKKIFSASPLTKDFVYQISKDKKHWPIRKAVDVYGDFILSLFPCWLLSPENVSSLLPLKKNLFDIVIFDEASQVFIESTLPTIYRGKNIVVAGDSKQLRPSATFMKRYMGADPDTQDDYSVQAALEVESLLDLAVARYESANLAYHYRSRHSELIDFSNSAFYGSSLMVAPNVLVNKKDRPIERYKVSGKWSGRKNVVEAEKVAALLKNILLTRKNNESVGIITFNSDQQACIVDTLDKLAKTDTPFRLALAKERTRFDNGEDTGLFIKNLENVQGDERDIIIFSTGYAPGDDGKIYAGFGALSADGGENRLNVAITRAKTKVIIVTSIEPEELRVDGAKNLGPKLLRDYLLYARAVSEGNKDEAGVILSRLGDEERKPEERSEDSELIKSQIKEKLEKAGYKVHTDLGSLGNRISLAVYDEKRDRYTVGVELDLDAYRFSSSPMERDVCKRRFLTSRGWNIMRVWCRDWWVSPQRVIKAITSAADKAKD